MQYFFNRKMSVLELDGEDVYRHLHQVTTSHVLDLQESNGLTQLSNILDIKGGLIAFFYLGTHQSKLYLETPSFCVENAQREITKYALRKNVVIKKLENIEVIHLWGHLTKNLRLKLQNLGTLLARNPEKKTFPSYHFYLDSTRTKDFSLLASEQDMTSVEEKKYDNHRIAAKLPEFGRDLFPGHIPLESSYLKQGISQTKGCYPGQETIARLFARGENTSHKICLLLTKNEVATDQVQLPVYDGKQLVGEVTSFSTQPDPEHDSFLNLARLHRKALAGDKILHINLDQQTQIIAKLLTT